MRGFTWSTERSPVSQALQEVMVDTGHVLALLLNEMSPAARELTLRVSAEIERKVLHEWIPGNSAHLSEGKGVTLLPTDITTDLPVGGMPTFGAERV